MAKQLIKSYIFTPGTKTIEIAGNVELSNLLLITNVTRNVILYNFADPAFAGTAISFNRNNTENFPRATGMSEGVSFITIVPNTASMLATDDLQIWVERSDGATITRPWPMGTDAFERMRVAPPKSMLDADFEYGLQPTKWQMIDLNRGTPSLYELPGSDLVVTSITTDYSGGQPTNTRSLITVVCATPHGLTTGTVINIQNLDNSIDGYIRAVGMNNVNTVPNSTTFTYFAKARVGSTSSESLLTSYTVVRKGGYYTNSGQTPTFTHAGSGATSTATVTLTFTQPHGYIPGTSVMIAVGSNAGGNNHILAGGSFFVETVPTSTTLTFTARNTGTITGVITGTVYARSDAFYVHRPLDGGVQLGAGGPNYGSHAIRMSKKYIRYQSGKAVNYNTAALFSPNYDINSVTATNTTVGSNIYIQTDDTGHGLQIGAVISLTGVASQGFAGTYTVTTIVDESMVIVTATNVLSTTTAVLSDRCVMSHQGWHGTTIRAGTFDDQNGVYWAYDGQRMLLGLRSSTFQIAGYATCVPGSNLVIGKYTRFREQLAAGDRVVIKGMTHVVTSISSATWMYVIPPYRGIATTAGIKIAKTNDQVVPQNEWNMDRADGSRSVHNPSGYLLDPSRIQMIGLQWTWYGAGFIDYMIRGPEGNYITVHRSRQNNQNYEAYMRSGNMPVRYEAQNESARSVLVTGMTNVDTSIYLKDASFFPNAGTVYIDNEFISYTTKTTATNVLSGLTRAASLSLFAAGSQRTYSAGPADAHSSGTGVILVSMTATPTVSHWGSAFLSDGGFDDDRGYIFNYQATNIALSTRKTTAFAIRLAPSVSNAAVGDLGTRDLINRAQLLLQGLEITAGGVSASNQGIVIEGVLNPSNFPTDPNRITWYSLQGTPAAGSNYGSGQPSFSQIAPSNAINFDGTATITTTLNAAAVSGATLLSVASTASIAVGDAVINTSRTSLQGNSIVIGIGAGNVTLSLPLIAASNNGDTVQFLRNLWASPGETIFSFISSPQSRDSLDLSTLKELTNTPIGGRGCYPNGPDVLFINVYLTQGTNISANLILRWSEAQA